MFWACIYELLAVWLLVLTYSTRYVSTVPPEYRLPGDVVPSHYDIRLLYDIDPGTGFSFYGVVYIHIKAKEPTSKIILHSQNNYGKINISGETHSPSVVESNLNDTFNLLTIDLDSHLDVHDTYILTIPFSGNVTTTDMFGVYASYYDNKKSGSREYFIATQFEAIFARRAFPCFDEPIYKATFGLTLGHNKGHVAISNMPIKKSFNSNALSPYWTWNQVTRTIKKAQSDFIWDRFTDSVAMPTYLVAYVISKMAYRESPDTSKWKFRVWAQPNAIDQTKYALTIGTKILKYYEEWFNLPFPLPKQDMVAIPDFGEGGMENWGLVMFRASNLLFDEKQSSYVEKENIAMVIAHELAHQWFGNLVTMKWWSDLWLNEGFATFVSTLGVAAAEPKWDYSFQGYEIISILEMDALESSHPVSLEIKDPADIMQVFDAISYFKGKILIRMITMFLGNKIFKEAIHNYLVKYSYSNAEQDDLWAELTAVSHKYKVLSKNVTIKQVMDSWTTQPGFPLLTVTRNYDTKTLAVTQARFLAINKNNITSSSAWWIPLRLTCEPDTSPQAQPLYWVADNEGITKQLKYEHASSPNEWVLINSDMIAPYRVNYDNRNWMLLVKALRSPQFMKVPKLGRMQLLSDAFQLAWTNRLNYSIALSLASYLQQEEQYGPLEIGMRALFNIQTILKRTQHYSVFKKFMRKIITKRYLKSGGLASKKIVNGDNLESVKMQTLLSQWACHMEISGCEENAIELFQRWMDTKNPDVENPIPLDLRSTVYCTAVSRGGEKHWQFVLDRKRRANAATAAETLQQALSCTSKTWVYMQMLEWVLAEYSEVRAQDSAHLICDILQSSIGFYVAKDFVYTKTKELHNVLPTGSLGRIASVLLDQLITQKQLDEFLKWRDENAQYLTNANLVIEQGIESARVNIEWVEHNMDTVVQMLKDDVE